MIKIMHYGITCRIMKCRGGDGKIMWGVENGFEGYWSPSTPNTKKQAIRDCKKQALQSQPKRRPE